MKIYFFGMLKEAVNCDFLEIEEHVVSVKELKIKLIEIYPKLGEMSFKIAVNQTMVEEDCKLEGNEDIAFLPPFAGG